jgi:hypothetical protein
MYVPRLVSKSRLIFDRTEFDTLKEYCMNGPSLEAMERKRKYSMKKKQKYFFVISLYTNGTIGTFTTCFKIFLLNYARYTFEKDYLKIIVSPSAALTMTHIKLKYKNMIWSNVFCTIINSL